MREKSIQENRNSEWLAKTDGLGTDSQNEGLLLERVDRLKNQLNRLELALEGAGVGYWDHDFVTVSVVRNRIWYEILGFSEEDIDANIAGWKSLIHPDDLPMVEKAAREHEEGKTPFFKVEHRMRTKDGGWKWIVNWGRIVKRDHEGKPLRATGIHLDITELKLMEEELARRDRLETIGLLAGGIAHDFNNLLTIILGNVALLRFEDSLSEGATKSIEEIERAVENAKKLTKQILTFARGGKPIRKIVSVEEILRESIGLALRGSNVKCEIEIAPDVHKIDADPDQIGQVFNNLLLNAMQAMPDGGIVRVFCRNFHVNSGMKLPLKLGDYVVVEISDSGVGIPESDLKRIFDPFFSTKKNGTGLGLTTAYSITKKHNGIIEVSSKEGGGATFRVYLPASGNRPKLEGEIKRSREERMLNKRVLVMDDEESIREIVAKALSRIGCEVVTVANSDEALDEFRKGIMESRPFDIVILDLTIPGDRGGKYVIAEISKIPSSTRSIVTSGYSGDAVISDFAGFGFDGRLVKPFTIQELYSVVFDVVEGKFGDMS